jgi:hypothetical protein
MMSSIITKSIEVCLIVGETIDFSRKRNAIIIENLEKESNDFYGTKSDDGKYNF